MADSGQTRRLFIAIPLPDEAAAAIVALVDAVRQAEVERSRIRWVRMDGLHLTLRFLGPTEPLRVEPIVARLAALAGRTAPVAMTIAGAGAFPSATRPRAIWLGVTAGGEALSNLATAISGELSTIGWPPDERRFEPHLTLARADGVPSGPATVARLVEAAADVEVSFVGATVALMESHTGRGPARYERIHGVALAGQASDP